MKYSKFIVFEGIDGSGKSTQARLLHKVMLTHNIACHLTHEPHSGLIGTYIKTLLQSSFPSKEIASSILAYLFAADRYEHLYDKNGIVAQLNAGNTVICDRYIYSSMAYQSQKSEQSQKLVHSLNKNFPIPDLIFYFNIDISTALSRIVRKKDDLESEKILVSAKTRYEELFFPKKHQKSSSISAKTVIIDALQDEKNIHLNILNALKDRLSLF